MPTVSPMTDYDWIDPTGEVPESYEPPDIVAPYMRPQAPLPPEYIPVPGKSQDRMPVQSSQPLDPAIIPASPYTPRYQVTGDLDNEEEPNPAEGFIKPYAYSRMGVPQPRYFPPNVSDQPPVDMGMHKEVVNQWPVRPGAYNPMRGELGPHGSEEAERMFESFMNRGPAVEFQGTNMPTQNDIDYANEEPTDAVLEAFEEKFGKGSTEKYLGNVEKK